MFHYFNFAGNGETPRTTAYFDLFWWIHLKEAEDEVAPLTFAQRTYDKFFASEYDGGEIPATHAQDGGTIPSTHAQDGRHKPRHEGNYYQEVSLHIIYYCWSILHLVEPNNKPLSSQDIASSVNRKLDTFTFTFTFSSWIEYMRL